jgi:hypothetical protein
VRLFIDSWSDGSAAFLRESLGKMIALGIDMERPLVAQSGRPRTCLLLAEERTCQTDGLEVAFWTQSGHQRRHGLATS